MIVVKIQNLSLPDARDFGGSALSITPLGAPLVPIVYISVASLQHLLE